MVWIPRLARLSALFAPTPANIVTGSFKDLIFHPPLPYVSLSIHSLEIGLHQQPGTAPVLLPFVQAKRIVLFYSAENKYG